MSLENRISSLKKNNNEVDWRKVHLIKISWTHVILTWTHIPTKKSINISHSSLWHEFIYMQKVNSLPSCKSSYQALPEEVREDFSTDIKKENYKADIVSITAGITGKKVESFNRVYCGHCEREALPRVLNEYKKSLVEKCGTIELTDNWDSLPNPKNDKFA